MSRAQMVWEPDLSIPSFMLTCKQASVLLSQAQDRGLGAYERLKLRFHLTLCDGCTHFKQQLEFLRRALRNRRDADAP
jgi:hypothetical protein